MSRNISIVDRPPRLSMASMQMNRLLDWWLHNHTGILIGLGAGLLWGFLTASSVTPRNGLVYDVGLGVVYQFRVDDAPIIFPADDFFADYTVALVQLTLILLVVCGLAGWATWQLTRLRARGEDQPALRQGLDWYVISLAMGGLAGVIAFRQLGLAAWFAGPGLRPIAVVSLLLEIVLPLYMGVALFLVWLLRLKSIRAPDWETHYPKPVKRPPGAPRFGWPRRKGGESPEK